MTFKEQIAADADVFFNENEFAEPITYNGVSMLAIPEVGENPANGNLYTSEGQTARARFLVPAKDVPDPKPQDKIVHKMVTWYMAKILESDSVSHYLECTSEESAWSR
jgi:hypothetical protein